MTKLEHFQKYQTWYITGALISFFFINNTIIATSVIMEAERQGGELPFQWWQPFAWEYSSAIGTLILIPGLFFLLKKFPIEWRNLKRTIPLYLAISIPFSVLHVGIMVGIRKMLYWAHSQSYEFGNITFELIYEYRKDFWAFIAYIAAFKSYQFALSRLTGEANLIADGEDTPRSQPRDRLLIKKLGKEFIIKLEDVEWMEASGNYVNLHIKGRIYPTRATLSGLIDQISEKDFCRIHRSHAINLDWIDSITPLSSGDSVVKLTNGKVLNLTRRYKGELKARLH